MIFMTEDNKIQPVDSYVLSILEHAKRRGVQVDLENPTRGQRLEAALYFDKEGDNHKAMEIMIGKRVGTNDREAEEFFFMKMSRAFHNNPESIRSFYACFSHRYSSN